MVSAARTPLFTLLPKQNTWCLFSTASHGCSQSSLAVTALPTVGQAARNILQKAATAAGKGSHLSPSSVCAARELRHIQTRLTQSSAWATCPRAPRVGWLLLPALALLCCHILLHILLSPPHSLLQSPTRSCSAPYSKCTTTPVQNCLGGKGS